MSNHKEVKCTVCNGQGYLGNPDMFPETDMDGGYYHPPPCIECDGTGTIEPK